MEQEAQPNVDVPVADENQTETPVVEEQKTSEPETVAAPSTQTDSTDEWDEDSSSSFKKHTANAALGKMFSRSRQQAPEINVEEVWKKEEAMTQEERRKRYKTRDITTLDDITPWSQQAQTLPQETNDRKYAVNAAFNEKISLWHGDITHLEIDAVVNAANETCLGGGGIDGAIHRAAGPQLYEECRTLHGCPTGQTKITRGYNLPAKYVLHTVGPVGEYPEMLQSCYRTCLELVEKHGIKTVAFCGISTGIFGYPLFPASRIAIETVRQWFEEGEKNVDRIIFCTFLAKEKDCYEKLMPEYFPTQVEKKEEEEVKVEEAVVVEEESKKQEEEEEEVKRRQQQEEEEAAKRKQQEEEEAAAKRKQEEEEAAAKRKQQEEEEEQKRKQQQEEVVVEETKPSVVVVEEDTSSEDLKRQEAEDSIRRRLEEREKNKQNKKLGKREEVEKQQQLEKDQKSKEEALKRQQEQRERRLNKKSENKPVQRVPVNLTSSSTSVFDSEEVKPIQKIVEKPVEKVVPKEEKKPAVSEGFLLKKSKKEEGKEVVKSSEEEKIPTKFIVGGVFFVAAWAISFILKRK